MVASELKEEIKKETEKLKDLEQEISLLYRLGVEDYEIKYLIALKNKSQKSNKVWQENIL